LQLVSNGKFRSVEHRVLANKSTARVSVAAFCSADVIRSTRVYGPIGDPPLYRSITIHEYLAHFLKKGLDGQLGRHTLDRFLLRQPAPAAT